MTGTSQSGDWPEGMSHLQATDKFAFSQDSKQPKQLDRDGHARTVCHCSQTYQTFAIICRDHHCKWHKLRGNSSVLQGHQQSGIAVKGSTDYAKEAALYNSKQWMSFGAAAYLCLQLKPFWVLGREEGMAGGL